MRTSRKGMIGAPRIPVADRFWKFVTQKGDCWEWAGRRNDQGYGWISVTVDIVDSDGRPATRKRPIRAHRWAYEFLRCEIPDGLSLDHLCRNRACVNPWHLEPVTHAVNVRRGRAPELIQALNASRTRCIHGHEFSPENTALAKPSKSHPNGGRICRTCRRERDRIRREAKRKAAVS